MMASNASFSNNTHQQPRNNNVQPNSKFRPMLSTKQANTRLNDSDEQLDVEKSSSNDNNAQPTTTTTTQITNSHTSKSTTGNNNNNNNALKNNDESEMDQSKQSDNNSSSENNNKTNISKDDLIRLLSMLKSELQSKEMALAAIKCEQLKRLINPVEISRSSLAKTYIQLQDRLRAIDQNNNNKVIKKSSTEQTLSASTTSGKLNEHHQMDNNNTRNNNITDRDDLESLNMLNTLLELLDRHPLLALPRDSIYCLDFNCNELSTKNYLNLKIQHLDNLINQHRRFRFYMNERLKRSEERYLDLTREMEQERNAKFEDDRSDGRVGSKSVLLKHIVQLKESLEKERASKQAIVMTLLNDLLDQRENNDSLKKENIDLETKLANLEIENTKLKTRVDLLTAKAASLTSSSSPSSRGSSKIAPSNASQSSATNITIAASTTSTQNSSLRSGTMKPVIPAKTNSSPQSTAASTNSTSKRSIDSALTSSSTTTNANTTASATNQRSTSTNTSRLVGSSSTEHAPNRIQSLFKSASVVSPSQQVRGISKSSSGTATNSMVQSTRGGIQPMKKPQVPAKPAQLLDQQRSPLG